MRALKIICVAIAPAVVIVCTFWLGGWNFERGFAAAYVAATSFVLGFFAALAASEVL
jgi:hypothetical protein